jgi:SAM-dependent methyltransferase
MTEADAHSRGEGVASYPALEPIWDYIYPHEPLANAMAQAVATIKGHVGKQVGLRILDLCCGTGRALAAFASPRDKPHILGVDASRKMIHQARKHFPEDRFEDVRFLERNILDLASPGDVESGSYDVVLLTGGSIQHFDAEDRDAIFKLAFESVAPGGVLLVDVMTRIEEKKPGEFDVKVRRQFRDNNGILHVVLFVLQYCEANRIWQQNVVLKWSDGDRKEPSATCDPTVVWMLTAEELAKEVRNVGLQPFPLQINWKPTQYLCFVKKRSGR